jgi:AraC family transcriptional regulator
MSLRPSPIHGTITSRRQINSFLFTEAVYPPEFKIPKHFHSAACFYVVLDGTCTETFETSSIEAHSHSLLFRPAGEHHSNQLGTTTARCFLIEVDNSWLESQLEYLPMLTGPAIFQNSSLTQLAMRLRRESRQPDAVTPLASEALMLEMIAEACRQRLTSSREPPRWLRQMKEILHDRFLEPLTLSEIAVMVGVHPVYLASAFRRYCIGLRQLRPCDEWMLLRSSHQKLEVKLSCA